MSVAATQSITPPGVVGTSSSGTTTNTTTIGGTGGDALLLASGGSSSTTSAIGSTSTNGMNGMVSTGGIGPHHTVNGTSTVSATVHSSSTTTTGSGGSGGSTTAPAAPIPVTAAPAIPPPHLSQTNPQLYTGKVPALRSADDNGSPQTGSQYVTVNKFDSNQPSTYGRDAVYILDIKTLEPLSDQDVDGTSDPFLKIWIDGGSTCVRTLPRKSTLEPMWTAYEDTLQMVFPLSSEQVNTNAAWNGTACLHFEAWDEDALFNDFIGYGRLPLSLGTIAPFVRFRSWSRAEHFMVQLWDKKGRKAGALSVRLSHCMLHNYIDRWITNYVNGLVYVPTNQRMTAAVPFYQLTVPEQPSILRELLQNVSNRLARSWLAAPSTTFVGRSIIAALLLIHGALPETAEDEAAIEAAEEKEMAELAAKEAASAAAAASGGGNNSNLDSKHTNHANHPHHHHHRNGSLSVPKRSALSGLPIPPLLRSPSQGPNVEIESMFMKPAGSGGVATAHLDSKQPIGAAVGTGGATIAAAVAASDALALAGAITAEVKHMTPPSSTKADGSSSTNTAALSHALQPLSSSAHHHHQRLTFQWLSAKERHAAQRDPQSLLSKQVNALLAYLYGLLSIEYLGNNLCYGNRIQHRTVPITDLEIKQNTIVYFAFLTRVVHGGGWQSLLNPEKWSGAVVSNVWNLVFTVPAFQRVDWNDEHNDPLCQSLLDSVMLLMKHTDVKHSLKSHGDLDVHSDCFGSCGLKTTYGDAADANPYALRVRRATSTFSKHDKVIIEPPTSGAGAGAGAGAGGRAGETTTSGGRLGGTGPSNTASSVAAAAKAGAAGAQAQSLSSAPVPIPGTSGSTARNGSTGTSNSGGAVKRVSPSPSPLVATPVIEQPVTSSVVFAAGEAALQSTLARVNTDIGSTTPVPSLDEAKRLAVRLQLYNSPNLMFVAGGMERAAIANALDVLFQNDRLHIEAHLLPRTSGSGDQKRSPPGSGSGTGSGSSSLIPDRDGRDAERLQFPLLLERPWFEGELEIARWAAANALNAPFTVDAFPINPKSVTPAPSPAPERTPSPLTIDHVHNPFLILNYKRFAVLNGFINYLMALPPWNLALVIQSSAQLETLEELATYEGMMSQYPKCPNFENDAFNLRWKQLFWRAGIIAQRTRAGHSAKRITPK